MRLRNFFNFCNEVFGIPMLISATLAFFFLFNLDVSYANCRNSISGITHGIVRDVNNKILRYSDFDGRGIILDSQLIVAASKFENEVQNANETKWQGLLHHLERTADKHNEPFHYWMTEPSAREFATPGAPNLAQRGFPTNTRMLKIDVPRDSADYQSIKNQLDQIGLGKTRSSKGGADQSILSDVFFASHRTGAVPTFGTADGGIFKPLCRLNPDCAESLGRGSLFKDFQQGFDVTLKTASGEPKTIRIVPFGS